MTLEEIRNYIFKNVDPDASVGVTQRQARDTISYLSEYMDEAEVRSMVMSHLKSNL